MKLLHCDRCGDVIRLFREPRSCKCGASRGAYDSDGKSAWHTGGVPLGFSTKIFEEALAARPQRGRGRKILAFIIPVECKTMREVR